MKTSGFTLLEFLVVMIISAIMLITYEFSSPFLVRQQEESLCRILFHGLQHARLQALTLQQPIEIGPFSTHCSRYSHASIAIYRINQSHYPPVLLKTLLPFPTQTIITNRACGFRFLGNGHATPGTFTIQTHDHKKISIIVNRMGRIRMHYHE